MARVVVAHVSEIGPGQRRLVEYNGRSVGVFNVDGEYYAVRNRCPHQGVPLCEGQLGGTFLHSKPHEFEYGLEGRIITCPAHRWQFDITTGKSVTEPERVAVRTFQVTVEEDHVVVYL